ncbi:N-acetylglucosamine kinase [Deinococcus alpinitundrae]|uniref:N-acetylglucosamine kinase n=1 Tax=Deinococcus alpinitundrae TaxID=468913 RepID=UPI00137B2FD1|nr:BadF/BadG/BcrA/BcrD ATPase family protein [Deinococcus alpinitundrae]
MRGDVVLTLDLGGSSSKWGVFAGDQLQASGSAAPISGHLYTAGAREALTQGLSTIHAGVQAHPAAKIEGVVAGVAGLQAENIPLIAALIAQTFQLSPNAVSVTDDLHLAYAAHFLPSEGTLIYAGTGSMAYHRSEGGEVMRAGGHGFLIDDAGGAFWQGREGLRAVLRQADEQHPETPLAAALYAAVGSRAWPDIRAHVYAGGRAALARLAPAVYRAALDGDPDALRIQQQAGEELARLGRVVLERTGGQLVAAAGGAVNSRVLAALQGALGPRVQFRPGVSPLLGGPVLARQLGLLREEVSR